MKLELEFEKGLPSEDGWYLVKLVPGVVGGKPYDVDFCRAKSPSDGGGREWATWYPHNVVGWARLPSASVSSSGDEPEYDPRTCSLWHPASEPPKQTEWVIASADEAVRCVAWNNDDRRWEDWDNSGFDIDNINWWMSSPLTPDKASAAGQTPAAQKETV